MKNIRQIEALVDAIASLKGWSNPDSQAYQVKNPLVLTSFARAGKHEITDTGVRIFGSALAGYKSCCFDVQTKLDGNSRAGIKRDDKLINVLRVYGLTEKLGQQQAVKYLRRSLLDQSISLDTPLSYFRCETTNPENGQDQK